MKKKLCILTAASALALATSVQAQGLLSIGNHYEFDTKMPFTFTVGLGAGWDSNVNQVKDNEADSAYLSGVFEAAYNTGDRRTSYAFGASYSPRYYTDAPDGVEDFQNSANVNFSVQHKVNPRLQLNDNFYFAYEFQPNFEIGASAARRTDAYLYGSNSFSVSYSFNRRFSSVTGYAITGIDYQDDAQAGQNYLAHLFSEELRYAFSKVDTLALTYRFGIGNYDNGFGDYTSHYILTGLDHSFSRKTFGSFRVGAEIRDRDNGSDSANPYFEGSLSHTVAKHTAFRWYGRYGYDDSDISGTTEHSAFRTGLSLQQQFNSRLAGNLGVNYVHDKYDYVNSSSDDDIIGLTVGLDYQLYRNLVLNAGYTFTTVSSDNQASEYDRQTVSLGVTARF